MINLPKTSALVEATIEIMGKSGSEWHHKKIDEAVAAYLRLTEEQLSVVRHGKRTEFAYRMAWARQRLKQEKKILNMGKGYWKAI